MTPLAAVVAAWRTSVGKDTWHNPTQWDARMPGALIEWGYQASDVERLLLGVDPAKTEGTDSAA